VTERSTMRRDRSCSGASSMRSRASSSTLVPSGSITLMPRSSTPRKLSRSSDSTCRRPGILPSSAPSAVASNQARPLTVPSTSTSATPSSAALTPSASRAPSNQRRARRRGGFGDAGVKTGLRS
jgi:hypothetical protein